MMNNFKVIAAVIGAARGIQLKSDDDNGLAFFHGLGYQSFNAGIHILVEEGFPLKDAQAAFESSGGVLESARASLLHGQAVAERKRVAEAPAAGKIDGGGIQVDSNVFYMSDWRTFIFETN